ncbi:MAG: hypothetical protein LBR32_09965 [Propionibacteriaceae bacterium]|nr:hypothetical protein [Propionibacteriaceae bacterium]
MPGASNPPPVGGSAGAAPNRQTASTDSEGRASGVAPSSQTADVVVIVYDAGADVVEVERQRTAASLARQTLESSRFAVVELGDLELAALPAQLPPWACLVAAGDELDPPLLEALLASAHPGCVTLGYTALTTPDGSRAGFDQALNRLIGVAAPTGGEGVVAVGGGEGAAPPVDAGPSSRVVGQLPPFVHGWLLPSSWLLEAAAELGSGPTGAAAEAGRGWSEPSAEAGPGGREPAAEPGGLTATDLWRWIKTRRSPALAACPPTAGAVYRSRRLPTAVSQVADELAWRGSERLLRPSKETPATRLQYVASELNHAAAETLAVSYAFAPFMDTAGIVATKRMMAKGAPFDAVSHSVRAHVKQDAGLLGLVQDTLGHLYRTLGPADPADTPGVDEFARQSMLAIQPRLDARGPYRQLYSRAQWPASNVVAALVKARFPQTFWQAEFSDPLLLNMVGEERQADRAPIACAAEIDAAIRRAGLPVTTSQNYFEWVEDIAFALADEIVFTNPNQRDFMLSRLERSRSELAARGRELARVSEHPTLPAAYYRMRRAPIKLPPGRTNIGYFGNFYATRSADDLLGPLSRLAPAARRRLALHIFTEKPKRVRETLAEAGLDDCVFAARALPYFEFLNACTRMDWLVMADAHVRGVYPLNPYLPSKWSDYRGSGTKVWAMTEDGSILSGKPLDAATPLGDDDATVAMLERLAGDPGGA